MKRAKYSKKYIMEHLFDDFIIWQHYHVEAGTNVNGPGKFFGMYIDENQKAMLEKHYDDFCRAMR